MKKKEKITLTKEELNKLLLAEYKKGFIHGRRAETAQTVNATEIHKDGGTVVFRGTAVEKKHGE